MNIQLPIHNRPAGTSWACEYGPSLIAAGFKPVEFAKFNFMEIQGNKNIADDKNLLKQKLVHFDSAELQYNITKMEYFKSEYEKLLNPGDVAIIQNHSKKPYGHICIFDGKIWISDFKQIDMWGGETMRREKPKFEIYRYSNS